MTNDTNQRLNNPLFFTHENQINAAYMDMMNKGQNAVWVLGGNAMTLTEWRDMHLSALKERRNE